MLTELTLALSHFLNAVSTGIGSLPVTADLLWPAVGGPSCKFPRLAIVAGPRACLLNIMGTASGLRRLLFCIPNCDARIDPFFK